MPFCYSPWTNVDVGPTGTLSPCCKYQFANDEQRFDIKIHTVEQYKDSGFLGAIKNTFLENSWPEGCRRCRVDEENNIKSKRQLDIERWQPHYDQYKLTHNKFITASIAFGNTCNLTCITCGPNSSSRWQKEYQVIYGKKITPFHFYKENFVSDFVQQSPEIIHLDIPGGEPFLSGINEQKQLLEHYISTGQSSKITLHYTTNATVFPDDSWWQLWEHFKEIDMQLSIDGIETRFEYIRYPAEWKVVGKNVEKYIQCQNLNFRLSVSHTVSAYNIFYLDEFLSWAHNIGLPAPWLGRVHNPTHMRPTVWPQETKKWIAEHLHNSQHSECVMWADLLMNQDDSIYFENFVKYLHQHDSYRQLDFKKTFPELATYI
jgi:hypothetical protein